MAGKERKFTGPLIIPSVRDIVVSEIGVVQEVPGTVDECIETTTCAERQELQSIVGHYLLYVKLHTLIGKVCVHKAADAAFVCHIDSWTSPPCRPPDNLGLGRNRRVRRRDMRLLIGVTLYRRTFMPHHSHLQCNVTRPVIAAL